METVIDAVTKEIDGPGKLLSYRALNQKLRSEYDIRVPRHLVCNVMAEIDPDGLEARQVHKKIKKPKVPFTSKGPMWLISVDGHDKLCGHQNWTFPLGVYGFIDTFSKKMLSLSVVHSNSDPLITGKLYLDLLYGTKFMPCMIRMDKGTETGPLATMHVYLLSQSDTFDDPMDAIIYGPSTSNKIERWWRDLHHRLEKYFKAQLRELLDANEYNPHNPVDRQLLAYIYIPVIQRECDIFVKLWNNHRIREQANLELPTGIPAHMFDFPEKYQGTHMGMAVRDGQLEQVAEFSGVLNAPMQFLDDAIKHFCEDKIANVEELQSKDAINVYRMLKNTYSNV